MIRTTVIIGYFTTALVCCLFSSATLTRAQKDTVPKERLWSGSTKRGLLDADSHDSYVINACRCQKMTVQLKWKHQGNNSARFIISSSPDFLPRKEVGFIDQGDDTGTYEIEKTGNFYIFVEAQPYRQSDSEPIRGANQVFMATTVHRVAYTLGVKLKGRGDCTSAKPDRKTEERREERAPPNSCDGPP